MMLKKSRILLIGAASVLAFSACDSKEAIKSSPAAKEPVAATVNGHPIPVSTVELMVRERTAQGQPDTPELRKAIVDNLAMQHLVSAEAVKKGVDKQPDTQRQLELVRQSILANAFVADYLKNTPVTDEMLKAEYDKAVAESGEFKARHILVKEEAEANAIVAKLKTDIKQFEALAKEKSMDPGSKVNGGDLGWFNPRSMVPEFGAAVAKLEKGKFTETPVKTQFGYHVILLEDSRKGQIPPFETVKDQLKQQVQRSNLTKMFEDMKTKAKIEMVNAPAVAAPAPAAK
ncbi:MAG: foldase protein PrsA [Telluria sp.]